MSKKHRRILEPSSLYLLPISLYHQQKEFFVFPSIFTAKVSFLQDISYLFTIKPDQVSYLGSLFFDSLITDLKPNRYLLSIVTLLDTCHNGEPDYASFLTCHPILTLTSCLSDSSDSINEI